MISEMIFFFDSIRTQVKHNLIMEKKSVSSMKEKRKISNNAGLHWFFLLLLIALVITPVSAATGNQFVFYSVHTPDYQYAVDATNDNNIVFHDNNKGTVPWSYNIGRYIGSIAISPDGRYVSVGCDGGLIFLFDRDGNLLWKKGFGDAAIRALSFSQDGNYLDASNAMNQAFYISRNGNLVSRPTTSAITPVPSATYSSISRTSASPDNVQGNNDSSGFLGINNYIWGFLALIGLWILWVNISKNRKKPSTGPYHPPIQNGVIYVDTVPTGAEIHIDGIYYGISPLTISNVIPATHTLRATLNGYHPETQRINISAGQNFVFSPNLRKIISSPPKRPPQPTPPKTPRPSVSTIKSITDLVSQLGVKSQQDREEAQKQLIIKVNTDGKPAIQQIIKELEKQPSGVKREIVNLLYYLSKESHDGQKVTEELILALTSSSPETKWLIIQTLGRLKDKRALSAIEAAVSDTDFLVKYWAVISLKSIQES